MASKVIILDRSGRGSSPQYNYVLWANVPAGRQAYYANLQTESVFKGATQAEHDAIKNGQVAEKLDSYQFQPGDSLAQIGQYLQQAWTSWQSKVNGENKYDRYGTKWDGVSWTQQGA